MDHHQQHLAKNPDGYCGIGGYGVPFKLAELSVPHPRSKAVFLSYASQDAEVARRIAAALEAVGVEVWLDQSALMGGEAWDAEIRRQIRECALFVPLISASTEERSEGYFRLEWRLAEQRTHLISRGKAFVLPVAIDATPEVSAQVPDTFREVQWTRLHGDADAARLVARIAALLAPPDASHVKQATVEFRAPAEPVEAITPRSRPSIAVLPFDNISGDREQEYFADGIVEEIITGLSRIKGLVVIARNSTFTYKGRRVDVKVVGRELGARYVLEGSVRRSGNQVRVCGQLIEAETAAQVWASRYDGTLDDIFALQDTMTMSVIGALEPTLRRAEIERALRKRPGSLDAYDLYLRALPLTITAMPEDADKALPTLLEALRLEPDYPIVHALIAWCYEQRWLRGGMRGEDREVARRHAHRAIETGADDATALAIGGFVVGAVELDRETALEAIDRALTLSPSSSLAFGFSALVRSWSGDSETAIAHASMAMRLSPHDPMLYVPHVACAYAHFFSGNDDECVNAAIRVSAANPRFSPAFFLRAAALGRLGRLDEARSIGGKLLELQPNFTVSGLLAQRISSQQNMEALGSALRQVGLPE